MKTGIELITQERKEQIEKHGRSVKRDVKENDHDQLVTAAIRLIQIDRHDIPPPFGWSYSIWDKMNNKPKMERLVIAAALLAAEIDRLNTTTEQDK